VNTLTRGTTLHTGVAKKAFDNRTQGVRREGFESGLLKIGIEGGFFNFLVSKNSRNPDANFYL